MRNASGVPVGGYVKDNAPIGAGGYVVGFDQSADGLLMTHNPDVTVPLIRTLPGDTEWRWMLSPASLAASEYDPLVVGITSGDGAQGCAGTRIAPSNKNIIYSYFNSRMMKSINGAAAQPTFTRCAMGEFYTLQNAGQPRYANPLIDIHPTNPDIVLMGTPHYPSDTTKSGAFYTTDGGVTRTKITGLSNALVRGPDPDRNLVGIDPGDATKGYVHVGGIGLYPLTITAGGVMTAGALIAGSPLRCGHLFIAASGDVFVCAGGTGAGGVSVNDLYKRTRAGVVTTYTTGCGSGASTVAVNPNNELIIYVADDDQRFKGSFDGGGTWKQYYFFDGAGFTNIAGEVKWIGDRGTAGVFAGKLMFDRVTANKLWLGHGLGIGFIDAPTTNVANQLQLSDFSNGNEEKVAGSFVSVPGDAIPILGNWDYSLWKMKSLTKFINTGIVPPYNGGSSGLAIARDLDYASNGRLVAAMAQVFGSNVYSDNDADSWSLIPGQSAAWGQGGAIAANTDQQIIVLETNNGLGRRTSNFGATWNTVQLIPGVDTANFINASAVVRHSLTADKQRSGVFALVYTIILGGGYGETKGGLWVTEDSGATWTQKITGVIGGGNINAVGVPANRDPRQYWGCRIEYIPGFSGEILYTPHNEPLYTDDRLYHITGDGTSTVTLGDAFGVKNVWYFDFGPIAPGQTRPSVAFYGTVSGVEGLYLSHDWFATAPVLLERFPLDNLSTPGSSPALAVIVGCDRNIFGRVFIGGIGWKFYDYRNTVNAT